MANSTPEPPPPQSQPTPPPIPSPANPLQNRSVLIGLAGALLGILILSCCCCGGCVLVRGSLGLGGGGLGLGSGSSRLVGTWKGQDTTGFGINYTIELKSNGRYEVHFEGRFVGSGTTTGTWRVKLVEDDRTILDTADDSIPDETIGWTVVFEDSNQILMHQPNGDSWRLKRQ